MTGKDLILYILQNNLEDKPIFGNGKLLGFLTVSEAAAKFDVGVATVCVWFELGVIDGVKIGDEIYISATATPSKKLNFNINDEILTMFIENYSRKD